MTSPRRTQIPTLGIDTQVWEYGAPVGESRLAPLLLVHGFRGDHHGLELIAQELSAIHPDRPLLVPDLPGFGRTPAIPGAAHSLPLYGRWLRALADAVRAAAPGRAEEPAFDVLGHSFGSLVVAQAVSDGLQPGRVVLVNAIAAPALDGPSRAMTALARAYYRAGEKLPDRASRALLGNPLIVRGMSEVMTRTKDRALRSWVHHQHARYFSDFADTSTLLQAFRASTEHAVAEFAPAITQPTLLIAGDSDDIAPLPTQVSLRNRLPDATLRVVPGVGHLVHYEAPVETAGTIADFLAHTPPNDVNAETHTANA